MAELGSGTMGGRKKAEPGPDCPNTRHAADILAGLPAHVMDECVQDLAEAVVAVLLSQATAEPDEDEHASGDLRKV